MGTKEILKKKVSAISLGCDKNRVDLEKMLFKLKDYGLEIVESIYDSDIVIVNTCSFILPAKQEAIENILQVCELKKNNKIEKIIVTGCLSERYYDDIKNSIKEVDAYLKLSENENILNVILNLYDFKNKKLEHEYDRVLTNNGKYAYLKIADGCSNVCSYCTIPRIRGRYKSVDMNELIKEAKSLAEKGVKELIIVAQDTTRYGEDLYNENKLIELLTKLSKIDKIEWIRLHYAYPEKVTDELLEFINNSPKMCKYLDMPLQHIEDKILTSMRRKLNEDDTRKLIRKIKENYPDIKLRTTFIVGYPGETKKDFKKLCDFLIETKFDFAGFFPYYREENTISYFMKNQINNFTKKTRLKKILKIQQNIMTENMKSILNNTFKVLIDYFDETSGNYIGHTNFLSPTVDFDVMIEDDWKVGVGDMVDVVIKDFDGKFIKGEIKK